MLTKSSPSVATGAHVSIIGHITVSELRRLLTETEAANGFGNRFLWLAVRRSKYLPFGGDFEPDRAITKRIREALNFGREVTVLELDSTARRIWEEVYLKLSIGKAGLIGAMIARSEPQALRLAMLYALLDKSRTIQGEHLAAGLALWQYAEDSALHIFGDALGDPLAEDIRRLLREAPEGMARTAIRDRFGRHKPSAEISRALSELERLNLAERAMNETGGRPAEIWRLRDAP